MMKLTWFAGAAALAVVGLAGCGKSSAVATGPASPSGSGANSALATNAPAYAARTPDPRDAPVPQVEGKPMWAANRRHTAEENAQYQFARNGGDFSAKSESEYVSDVHHFVDHPPRGTETLDRPNGDKLMYAPKANVFAVVARNGAPRTMFKPRDGLAYWSQQKEREAQRGKGGAGEGGGTQES
jgi:pyocin large subunit-like protein